MAYLEPEGKRLVAAMKPLALLAERTRRNIDVSDPKAANKFKFLGDIEAALNAVADYAKAADQLLNPKDTPFVARTKLLLAFHHDPAPLTRAKLDTLRRELAANANGL